MELIQRAAIYKLIKKDKFLIHGVSTLQMGGGIASEPFIWLNGNTVLQEVVTQLLYALNKTKVDLPNPLDWKESAKKFLQKTGLKKQSDLYKDSIHVSIFMKEGIIFFTPMKNLGSKGFVNVSKEKIEIAANAEPENIFKALDEALRKCE